MSRKENETSTDIKRMSNLLLSGATMLAESCPDCNVPLFKKNEKIYCPKCGRKAVYASSEDEIRQIEHTYSFSETQAVIQDVLTGKLNFLANRLATSEKLDEMSDIVNLMNLIADLFMKIAKIMR